MDATESGFLSFSAVTATCSVRVSPFLVGRISGVHDPVLALPRAACVMEVVLVGLVIRVPLVLLLAGVILLFGLLLRLFANHATTVTTGGHVVLVAVFSLYVAVHEGVIFDVCVDLGHSSVCLTFGHSVDEVVLHKLVALDDSPGVLLRHHLE